MGQKATLNTFLVSLLIVAFMHNGEADVPCSPSAFRCLTGECIQRSLFCDGSFDCSDNSDEKYCSMSSGWNGPPSCPSGWIPCPNTPRYIPSEFKCDGRVDCYGLSEEADCDKNVIRFPGAANAKKKLEAYFLRKRRSSSRADKWGSQVHRIAVALYLADESTFHPENSTGNEIRYELMIQLLHRLAKVKKISSQELALYIHALLAAGMNPKDFYEKDLVLELRRRVEATGNYTNPFLILVLCNAGDTMTVRDVERVIAAYDSNHRPSWADLQALSSMALACISSRTERIIDKNTLDDMLQELKNLQLSNGTIGDFRTTALVTQAMFIHDSYRTEFDQEAAVQVIIAGSQNTISLQHAYYALPILSAKSLLNVTTSYYKKESVTEEEALKKALDVDGETMVVQYSVWMGEKIDLARTWKLRMKLNSTIYDAAETVANIDNRQKVKYIIIDGKPFITAMNGVEDDPEMGSYWFIYLKSSNSSAQPKIVEESPVDFKLQPNQEIILWYKKGPWNGQGMLQKTTISA